MVDLNAVGFTDFMDRMEMDSALNGDVLSDSRNLYSPDSFPNYRKHKRLRPTLHRLRRQTDMLKAKCSRPMTLSGF